MKVEEKFQDLSPYSLFQIA